MEYPARCHLFSDPDSVEVVLSLILLDSRIMFPLHFTSHRMQSVYSGLVSKRYDSPLHMKYLPPNFE